MTRTPLQRAGLPASQQSRRSARQSLCPPDVPAWRYISDSGRQDADRGGGLHARGARADLPHHPADRAAGRQEGAEMEPIPATNCRHIFKK